MPVKYVIKKMKGAFYAGSEKVAQKGLTLRRYLSLDGLAKMVKALRLSASSLAFSGLSSNEQKKVLGGGRKAKAAPRKTRAKAKKKRKR